MSKKTYIEFKCDICGEIHKELHNGKEPKSPYRVLPIPAKRYDCEGRSYKREIIAIEVCDKCFEEYWNFVQSRYDVVDGYGVEITIKEYEREETI